jgi:MazG family protein
MIVKQIIVKRMEKGNTPVPKPNDPNDLRDQFESFVEIVRILRRDCPWDKKQTNESIAHLLIEECYETIDAIEKGDDDEFSKELGDLLLHVVMHAVMAEQRGSFNMIDVIKRISTKLVNRHPHVFGEISVTGEDEVMNNWEAIKMKEGQKSILQGVPKALPALLRAERIQHKASRVGFDWDNKDNVWEKVEEELSELREEIKAGNHDEVVAEFGDVLFSLVNAARFEEVVPEEALQRTNNKFTRRFQFIEKKVIESGKSMNDMTLEELDQIWDQAKSEEK